MVAMTPGRGGGHERLGEFAAVRAAPEQLALGDGLAQIVVRDVRDRLRRLTDAGGAGALLCEPRRVIRWSGRSRASLRWLWACRTRACACR